MAKDEHKLLASTEDEQSEKKWIKFENHRLKME